LGSTPLTAPIALKLPLLVSPAIANIKQ
jgi:hypothetical protein